MVEEQKSFVVVFDKDCREYAETLMTLVSKKKSLRNVNVEREEFRKDRAITSDEYVLTMGEKGSAYNKQNFNDVYNNFGIHFGYYGAKAWISCEYYKWDENTLSEFHKEIVSIREKLGMNTDGIVEKDNVLLAQKKDETTLILNGSFDVFVAPILHLQPITNIFSISETKKRTQDFIDYVNYRRNFKKQQYRYAIALFFASYLHDFLEIKEENNEEQNEKQNF